MVVVVDIAEVEVVGSAEVSVDIAAAFVVAVDSVGVAFAAAAVDEVVFVDSLLEHLGKTWIYALHSRK